MIYSNVHDIQRGYSYHSNYPHMKPSLHPNMFFPIVNGQKILYFKNKKKICMYTINPEKKVRVKTDESFDLNGNYCK